jgi:hypothetical protein
MSPFWPSDILETETRVPEELVTRREMLALTALVGAGWLPRARADSRSGSSAKYPSEKMIRAIEKEGWVVEYKKANVQQEGIGLRGPSIFPPDKLVLTPVILEAQFKGKGRCNLLMPSYAHVCNQTCLATRVEVWANDKLLTRGSDYTVKPLVTRPMRNRFWQVSGLNMPQKTNVRVRVTGIISNAPAPANVEAARTKIMEIAAKDTSFDKKYKVLPSPHWLKDPGKELAEAASAVTGEDRKKRFATLLHILRVTHKKGKLVLTGKTRDPEVYVKEGMQGSCGANADFVNFAANAAKHPFLYYTEGYVAVPGLNYLGLHVWNTACCNGFFIADSLNPDLIFPEYAGYVATSVGPNNGHPAGASGSTSGGYASGERDSITEYYIYFSVPPYGKHKDDLAKLKIPEGLQLLGDFVAKQRDRVNRR